jgi:putative ABC transport system permease protein
MRIERDVLVATARAFVQLTALGYLVKAIFDADSSGFALALVGAMVLMGAFTAAGRARRVPRALPILVVSLGAAVAVTLAVALVTDVFEPTPRTLIPLGGMLVGNAMSAAAVALSRLGDDVRESARELEARLSLGATAMQAIRPIARRSLRTGMINVVDSTKTAGLVFIPGTILGMLLAGADPVDAVRLQLVLFYLLLGNVAIAVVLAVGLATRRFFTDAHQLRELGTH